MSLMWSRSLWVSLWVCQSLVKQPLSCRRALLKKSFQEKEGEFVFARAIDSDNTDAIAEFLEQSVRGLWDESVFFYNVCVCVSSLFTVFVCEVTLVFCDLLLSLTCLLMS